MKELKKFIAEREAHAVPDKKIDTSDISELTADISNAGSPRKRA